MNKKELNVVKERFENILHANSNQKTERLLQLRSDLIVKHNDNPSYEGAMLIRTISEEVGHE